MKPSITLKELHKLGFVEVSPGKFERGAVVSKPVKKPKPKKEPKIDIFCKLINQQFELECIPEFQFHSERKWRFDYFIPDLKLAIEVEGGVWTNGRHTRGKGFLGDMEKYNEANRLGYVLYRTVPDELMSNRTLEYVKKYLEKTGT